MSNVTKTLSEAACGKSHAIERDLSRVEHIAGAAQEAGENALPWMASLGYYDENSRNWVHMCGGSIVGPHSILTAAHCYKGSVRYEL